MILRGEEVFIVPSQYRDRVFLYAPLRSYLALTSSRHAAALSSTQPTAEQDALLACLRARPQVPHFRIAPMADVTPRIQRLTISLSDACNLRCVYCHTYRPNHQACTLPVTILEPLIAAFVRNTTAPILYFEFLGDGEPTRSFQLLKRCVELIRGHRAARPFSSKILLTTNGYFGPRVRRYLARNVDAITVSFDGFKSIQDLHRPVADGASSYPTVYETVRFFHQVHAAITLRITVTPYSIEHLDAILGFFQESFPGIEVRIEPVRAAGRALECFPDLSDFAGEVAKAIANSWLLTSTSLKLAKPYNGEGTMYDSIRTIGCPMLEYGNWKITADGNILCCDALVPSNPLFLGRCDFQRNTIPSVTHRINELRKTWHVDNNPLCADCFCKYHCSGMCPLLPPTEVRRSCDDVRKEGAEWLHAKASDGAGTTAVNQTKGSATQRESIWERIK